MEIVFVLIGMGIGVVIGVLAGKSKTGGLQAKLDMAEEVHRNAMEELRKANQQTVDELKLSREHAVEELRKSHEKNIETLKQDFEVQRAEQERYHKQAFDMQRAQFDETMNKVTEQLKTATNDMLKERQKEFAESSNENLGQLVNPLKETIEKMKQVVHDNTNKQTAIGSELKVNIEQMMRQSEAARQSADELTHALKHGTKVQGDWGETVLDELLQSQGLTRGVHYDTQEVICDAEGNVVRPEKGSSLRPDVILHLDERRELIIDSKVSLTNFIDYVNAENEADRQKFLKMHVDSVQKHVKELSAKNYASYIQPPKMKMNYVIMFVPHSGALWTAMNAQPDLWRKALDMNVYIADEQTLFAALKIINLTWIQITQAQNHEKVYALANEMVERVGMFCKRYKEMGKALDKVRAVYSEGEKKLEDHGQSIVVSARKLINLGAQESNRNPLPEVDVDDTATLEG